MPCGVLEREQRETYDDRNADGTCKGWILESGSYGYDLSSSFLWRGLSIHTFLAPLLSTTSTDAISLPVRTRNGLILRVARPWFIPSFSPAAEKRTWVRPSHHHVWEHAATALLPDYACRICPPGSRIPGISQGRMAPMHHQRAKEQDLPYLWWQKASATAS